MNSKQYQELKDLVKERASQLTMEHIEVIVKDTTIDTLITKEVNKRPQNHEAIQWYLAVRDKMIEMDTYLERRGY